MFKILFTQIICNQPMNCEVLHDFLVYKFSSESQCRNELINYADQNFPSHNHKVTFETTDRGFVAKVKLKKVKNYSKQIECIEIPK